MWTAPKECPEHGRLSFILYLFATALWHFGNIRDLPHPPQRRRVFDHHPGGRLGLTSPPSVSWSTLSTSCLPSLRRAEGQPRTSSLSSPQPLPSYPYVPVRMSGEGLTRRRGAASSPAIGTSSTGSFDAPPLPSSSAPKAPRNAPTSSAGGGGGSGAIEGRGKVAYDPRDFEDGGEAQQMPRLTIMEEVLLLGLKDKAVSTGR